METQPIRASATLKSGTITTGGTSQTLMAGNPDRRGWCVQNQSAGALYIKAGGTAVADQTSLQIPAGAYYEPPHVTTAALSIIGATTAQAYFAQEW